MSEKRGGEQMPLPEIQEVRLGEINEHDELVLETASGSTYNLTVTEARHSRPMVVMERLSSHLVRRGSHPVDIDNLLKWRLLGSCKGSLTSEDGEVIVPVAPDDEAIMIGRSVRMQSETGDPLYTSELVHIQWIQSNGEEVVA